MPIPESINHHGHEHVVLQLDFPASRDYPWCLGCDQPYLRDSWESVVLVLPPEESLSFIIRRIQEGRQIGRKTPNHDKFLIKYLLKKLISSIFFFYQRLTKRSNNNKKLSLKKFIFNLQTERYLRMKTFGSNL